MSDNTKLLSRRQDIDNYDDDDDEEKKPMILSSSFNVDTMRRRQRKQRANFVNYMYYSHQEEELSYLGCIWRFIASSLLTALILTPFLHSLYYQYNQQQQHSNTTITIPTYYPSDSEGCSQKYNISYTSLQEQIIQSSSYCSASSCRCQNPFDGIARLPFRNINSYISKWDTIFERNKQLAASSSSDLKVVFYGDSITEHWYGTDLGVKTQKTASIQKQFQIIFQEEEALALGIAGDRVSDLFFWVTLSSLFLILFIYIALNPPQILLLLLL